MHIVFCISSLGSGGAERVLSDLANRYVDEGHIVSILTLVSPETKPFYFIDPRINLMQTNKSSKGKSSIFKRLYNVSSSLLGIRKTIKTLNPDKVITFIDLMNVRVLLSCWGLNVSVIVSERTDPAHHRLPMKNLSEWLRLKLYPRANHLTVQTKAAAQYFPITWGDRMTIIPNVVRNPENIKNFFFDKIKNLISVGRLSVEKNHRALIIAFSAWVKKYPDIRLMIYGEGPERASLEKIIADLALQDRVMLPGAVQNIQAALLAADLFVFPSRYEGFPNALCEAMAMGLPVVASDCSGNAEVIQDGVNGFLFPVDDMSSLTKIVFRLLENPAECQGIAKNASAIVERYGPEKVYGLWDSLILDK